ncbi:MAG: hypothetical protein PF689_01925, partial [Deltaproteobacteria bacterium]|nr:hypothetical protein [Deltaproteobacteria bacterium]
YKKFCEDGFYISCSRYSRLLAKTKKSFKKHKQQILKYLKRSMKLSPADISWYFRYLRKFVKKGYLKKSYYDNQLEKHMGQAYRYGVVYELDLFDLYKNKLKKQSIPLKTAVKYFNYLRRRYNYNEYELGSFENLLKKYPNFHKYKKLVNNNVKMLAFSVDDEHFRDPELLSCGIAKTEKEFYDYLDYCVLGEKYDPKKQKKKKKKEKQSIEDILNEVEVK